MIHNKDITSKSVLMNGPLNFGTENHSLRTASTILIRRTDCFSLKGSSITTGNYTQHTIGLYAKNGISWETNLLNAHP